MRAALRIAKEFAKLQETPIENIEVALRGSDTTIWECSILAAKDSPYKGGTFHFTVVFGENYPFKSPGVTFTTKIYHPGISKEGAICVPILHEWKPTVSMSTVLSVIQDKLNNPSPDDPFEPSIAALLKNDRKAFLRRAQEYTEKYAKEEAAT